MIAPRIFPDYEQLSRHAADWLADRLRNRPTSLVSLAAGSTPSRTYELLAEHGMREPALVAHTRWIKLDEWGGLPMDDSATCEYQLRRTLITPLGAGDRYAAFASQPVDPAAECARIAQWLGVHGPIDLCVLGLGINGHLGFNEPAEHLMLHAHIAELAEASLTHAMLDQTTGRPTYGLTLGIADLLQAREILLLVSGAAKKSPLKRLLSGQIETYFPASFLHLHSRVTVLVDALAIGQSE